MKFPIVPYSSDELNTEHSGVVYPEVVGPDEAVTWKGMKFDALAWLCSQLVQMKSGKVLTLPDDRSDFAEAAEKLDRMVLSEFTLPPEIINPPPTLADFLFYGADVRDAFESRGLGEILADLFDQRATVAELDRVALRYRRWEKRHPRRTVTCDSMTF